jgi:hypothetical protein
MIPLALIDADWHSMAVLDFATSRFCDRVGDPKLTGFEPADELD